MRKKIMLLALIGITIWALTGCGEKKNNTGPSPEGVEEIEVEEIIVKGIEVKPIVVTWDNASIGSW